MSDSYWTTEQVAEYLGITVQQVYESARRREFPGNIGKQRGRRKLYRSDLIQAGPQDQETTENPTEAILWALSGIHTTLRAIEKELRAQRPTYFPAELITMNVTGDEGEEE